MTQKIQSNCELCFFSQLKIGLSLILLKAGSYIQKKTFVSFIRTNLMVRENVTFFKYIKLV